MFESVDARTDARTPARVPSYKLTLRAFGSGELKMVDGRTMDERRDDGPWLYYKLTIEPKGSGVS